MLTCPTGGTPPFTRKWFVNGSLVDDALPRTAFTLWKEQVSVDHVSAQFSGIYKCLASNAYGTDEAFLNVTVGGKCDAYNNRQVRLPGRKALLVVLLPP